MNRRSALAKIRATFTGLRFVITIASIVACISSCKKNEQKNDAVKVVKEWTGKEIKFPQGLPCTSMGKDTACVDLYSNNYKILLYVDSLGCTSCRLKLSEWKKIISESDSIFSKPPEFVFFFQPKSREERELLRTLKSNGFHNSVFIDKENKIDKLNKLPSVLEYQCFLLDKDNKVIMIGNPSLNSGIWTLYKKAIIENGIN